MVDEIGHISFNRLHLGGAGLAQTRAILPLVAAGLANSIPEVTALGAMATASGVTSLATGNGLPEHVRRAAFLS